MQCMGERMTTKFPTTARRQRQRVVIDSLRPISHYCKGQITQIEPVPVV
jgi:hypothetical protein